MGDQLRGRSAINPPGSHLSCPQPPPMHRHVATAASRKPLAYSPALGTLEPRALPKFTRLSLLRTQSPGIMPPQRKLTTAKTACQSLVACQELLDSQPQRHRPPPPTPVAMGYSMTFLRLETAEEDVPEDWSWHHATITTQGRQRTELCSTGVGNPMGSGGQTTSPRS